MYKRQGLGNGGTNFDAKTRRNSTDLEDIFIAHIAVSYTHLTVQYFYNQKIANDEK